MNSKKRWTSPQSIIIMAIILLIFAYIGVDIAINKPQIKSDIKEVKGQYIELQEFLDRKVPEIDSTLKVQANQINAQESNIQVLNEKVNELTSSDEE